tara:strand:+ start:995 stop:2098 length:1104 start_codon:yes stop_codon:yes gene_type:complete
MSSNNWYKVNKEENLFTPGLLVYPERIKKNIESMIDIAGGTDRLWPHVKTYKMSSIVKMQMEQGITRFKCATLSELKMLVDCQVDQILLAIQPTQEKIKKFIEFQKDNPSIKFSTLVDNMDSLSLFSSIAYSEHIELSLWVDINNGMNRTGVIPEKAADLYLKIEENSNLQVRGLHVYDGHIRPLNLSKRISKCNNDFQGVESLISIIEENGVSVPNIIAGGSPSFLPHSLRDKVFLSPGTTLLWDLGYKKIWEESPFLNAALVVTRLISKPNENIFCFDLGHKAIASEMPLPRVEILGLENSMHIGQSEEHLIVEHKAPNDFKVGDLFYAIPFHICPTVAKYNKAYTVDSGNIGAFWNIEARDYQI